VAQKNSILPRDGKQGGRRYKKKNQKFFKKKFFKKKLFVKKQNLNKILTFRQH